MNGRLILGSLRRRKEGSGHSRNQQIPHFDHGARDKPAFEIDAGKLAEEARFDGIFVLRTNAKIMPLQAVLRYRDLLKVENLFLRTKAVMRTSSRSDLK